MEELDIFSDVLEKADQALLQAKKENRGSCCFWKEG